MKIKGEYILREVVGENVLIPVGETALKFNGMIIINSTGAFIWKSITEGNSKEEILNKMVETFDVTTEEAEKDIEEFLGLLIDKGFIEV